MALPTVAQLLASGRLEAVIADPAAARARLSICDRHLRTAAGLIGADNDVAYISLYDAVRKAVTAHMLARGYRAPAKPRAHEAIGIYAIERIADPTGSIAQFHRIRRRRNQSEYDDLVLGAQDVAADLQHAHQIVSAVRGDL